jgi:hypothetical protein
MFTRSPQLVVSVRSPLRAIRTEGHRSRLSKDLSICEARIRLWRVKEWPQAPKSRKWELLRRIGEQWESQSFWPSSDLALKLAADADERDGVGSAGDSSRP